MSPEILAELLSAGLGETVTADELVRSGERIWTLSRLFNLRAGFTAADDTLPKKIIDRPLEDGPQAGKVFNRDDFGRALQAYYSARGWDGQGIPSPQKLTDLGLTNL